MRLLATVWLQGVASLLGFGPNPVLFYISLCLSSTVFVICKLGNDSQKAVQVLEKMSGSELEEIVAKDISGGLTAWALKIDPTFPQY